MKAGYKRHRIDISNIMPHVETDKLIDEQMPLWPHESNPQEYHDFQSVALEKVKCPDCRVVFERAFAKRRNRPASRNSKFNDPFTIEGICHFYLIVSGREGLREISSYSI